MPNIEIHGFGRPYGSVHYEFSVELGKLQTRIVETLRESQFAEFADDVVITTFASYCRYLNGKPAPYLRICDTDYERAKAIAGPLMRLGIDIEVIQLDSFYPAQTKSASSA